MAERTGKRKEGRVVRGAASWAWSEKGMEEFQFRFKSNTISMSASSAFAAITPTGRSSACFTSAPGPGLFLLHPILPLIAFNVSVRERAEGNSHLHGSEQKIMI